MRLRNAHCRFLLYQLLYIYIYYSTSGNLIERVLDRIFSRNSFKKIPNSVSQPEIRIEKNRQSRLKKIRKLFGREENLESLENCKRVGLIILIVWK